MTDKLQELTKISQEIIQEAASKYHYSVAWSEEDEVFIGSVSEWPSLAAHADTSQDALEEIMSVVCMCLYDGVSAPDPMSSSEKALTKDPS